MFVGWARDSFDSDISELSQSMLIDTSLLINTKAKDNSLVYCIYDDNKLQALISAYEFDKSILINSFYYLDISDELKLRLIKLLLKNISSSKSVLILASQNEVELFVQCGFSSIYDFSQAYYKGDGVAFNFSNAMAKSINSQNYLHHIKELDMSVYLDDRYEYITTALAKKSSLVLSNEFGYQHSFALNNSTLKISPWIVKEESYSEAEKFMRGLLHYRGLKKVISFIPNIDEIKELYSYYKFDIKSGYKMMCLNAQPNINFNKIYGL